jgi:hypothetical protein
MLLVHQTGSVKIGEVVRYTVTYTPSHDRILPSPERLYLRIRNSCAVALRAAFVHGPYTLCVAAYPAHFNPNEKFLHPRRYGVPEFEPMLKAGGTWTCHLVVPDTIRQSAGQGTKHGHFGAGPEHDGESVSWIVEVSSQVIFSTSAAVSYEILIARDEKSLSLGGTTLPVIGNQAQVPAPGKLSDYQAALASKDHAVPMKGVFSRAVKLKIEDTAALWDTPRLPGSEEQKRHHDHHHHKPRQDGEQGGSQPIASQGKMEEMANEADKKPDKPKRVHLVIVTHGLHSNLGGDMLYLKESIDAGVRQAKKDAKARRAKEREERKNTHGPGTSQDQADDDAVDDGGVEEDEEVVVRGYSGNATRTEKGIKYLGKRLARFVLSMTYPDQPYLPTGKAATESVAQTLLGASQKKTDGGEVKPAHHHSTTQMVLPSQTDSKQLYKITKISFIAHSLGGLVQTYAVAYIQKHSPQFFDLIEPINFIALASPFLGLNHENPLYVKFALDFGLVGRTGKDLGLTWRAPTIARSGWGALVSNLGENAHKRMYGEEQPESKPLLRILPTGPAHIALKKFRNRTVYSNVVNDGIVPLRTSCLLFLDWQGLERVEKARRETGLVETAVRAGWAELTGANVTTARKGLWSSDGLDEDDTTSDDGPLAHEESHQVPQPPTDATREDDKQSLRSVTLPYHGTGPNKAQNIESSSSTNNSSSALSGFLNLFRVDNPSKPVPALTAKQSKIYRRSQTINFDDPSATPSSASSQSKVTAGHDVSDTGEGPSAPPRTSFFESASDLLSPRLPPIDYILDPSKRPRTIFHDRIYHPWDIPPPPLKKRPTGLGLRRRSETRTTSSTGTTSTSPFPSPGVMHQDSSLSRKDYDDTAHTNPEKEPDEVIDSSQMRVEEKIARAYHRDLSWRKVLVKLEPDAHNNMIVRRMFANAFGWPVVKHLVDAHFSDAATARTRDDVEAGGERAKPLHQAPDETGAETKPRPRTEDKSDGDAAMNIGGGPSPDGTRGRTESSIRESPALPSERTASEAREDTDKLSALPATPMPQSPTGTSNGSGDGDYARPQYERVDSVSWSDQDWADSGDEADSDTEVEDRNAAAKKKEKGPHGTDSWNWAEKIVGKGAVTGKSRGGSPAAGSARNSGGIVVKEPGLEAGMEAGLEERQQRVEQQGATKPDNGDRTA